LCCSTTEGIRREDFDCHAKATGTKVLCQTKSPVERVFGIIKQIFDFRQFSLRGAKEVSGEWVLVSMPWHLKRMFNPAS
jgi:hypothetical protein